MSKRIVFCSDGTWESESNHSNVYKFYKATQVTAGQMPFYDDGVGADGNIFFRLVEGAMGVGIEQKIKDGYTKIAHVYEKGDQIFIVGFSRGAYTARALAGMVAACGLPTQNFDNAVVNTAYRAYWNRHDRANILKQLENCAMDSDAKITMVGVWDTVGSLGLSSVVGGVDLLDDYLDVNLHPNILNAYHAISIDEARPQFQPTLWNVATPGQTLEQVWFTGYHGDVGGGLVGLPPGNLLSDIPLAWMMSKAAGLGLQFDPLVAASYNLPLDASFATLPTHPPHGGINQLTPRLIADGVTLANSVQIRCHDPKCHPRNLKFVDGALATSYGVEMVVTPMTTGAHPS